MMSSKNSLYGNGTECKQLCETTTSSKHNHSYNQWLNVSLVPSANSVTAELRERYKLYINIHRLYILSTVLSV